MPTEIATSNTAASSLTVHVPPTAGAVSVTGGVEGKTPAALSADIGTAINNNGSAAFQAFVDANDNPVVSGSITVFNALRSDAVKLAANPT